MYTIITIYGRVKKSVMRLFIFIFIRFGTKLYRRTIGIPMGTAAGEGGEWTFFGVPKGDPRRQTILYVRLGGFLGRVALPEARAPAAPE